MTQPPGGRCLRPHPSTRLARTTVAKTAVVRTTAVRTTAVRTAVARSAAIVAVAVPGLVGCGGPSDPPPSAPVTPASPAQPNLAFVDTQATTEAAAGVKKAVETVFSYDSAQAAAVAENEQQYLTGAARGEFDQTFAQVKTSPVRTKTQVLDSGVLELSGAGAKVLVVAGQQSTGPGGQQNSATAIMLLTATRANGNWLLSQIQVSPRADAEPSGAPASPSATARDTALAAARRAAAVLLTVDAAKADSVFDAYESVATDPLLSQFRETRAHTVDGMKQSGAKASLDPESVAAVTSLSADGTRAEVLLGGLVNTQQQGGEEQRQIPARLTVVRQGTAWKVSGLDTVTPGS